MPQFVPLTGDSDGRTGNAISCEYNTIRLVQQKSRIPVPRIHGFEDNVDSKVNAQFMLMDCLKGNVGMDLGMKIPPGFKSSVFASLADVHVCMAQIQLTAVNLL